MKFSQLDERGLPFVVEPEQDGDRKIKNLCSWINSNKSLLEDKLLIHGAILFRGFDVAEPSDFELTALALEPKLREDYLGTSARRKLTKYVYTASEMPPYFPIPQHCEMSFTKGYPSKIFFCCLTPSKVNGETPLCDFQKVYECVDPKITKKWEEKGITYVRNYNKSTAEARWDPLNMKNWDEVFETTDKQQIEKICKEESYTHYWLPGDQLRLENVGVVSKKHLKTGKPVWFNHAHIFHPTIQYDEFRRMVKWLPRHTMWSLVLSLIGFFLYLLKLIFSSPEKGAMHCRFSDGSQIPTGELTQVRDAIWKNMVINQWQKGDMLFADNTRVSHGRLPFSGPRKVIVCMSNY